MFTWLRDTLVRILRGAIEELVEEVLDKAVLEVGEEIDAEFEDAAQREALKTGVGLLRAKAEERLRSRFDG